MSVRSRTAPSVETQLAIIDGKMDVFKVEMKNLSDDVKGLRNLVWIFVTGLAFAVVGSGIFVAATYHH